MNALGRNYALAEPPKLFRHKGVQENIGVEGVWFSKSSADPYGGAQISQEKKVRASESEVTS